MANPLDVIKEVMTLTSNVSDLKDQLKLLLSKVDILNERIVKLESREELIVERCRNAAIETVSQNAVQITKDVMNLANKMENLAESNGKKMGRLTE